MNRTALSLTVRVGCSLAYETTVPTSVLFVLKPRLDGGVLVLQEKLSFGIGVPSYEFQDSHGNTTSRSMFMPGRNEVRHDALVAVSPLRDSRDIPGHACKPFAIGFTTILNTACFLAVPTWLRPK